MDTEILDGIPPFCYITDKEKKQILKEKNIVNFSAKDMIMTADNPRSHGIYLLLEGRVKVNTYDGLLLGYITAPSYFGERHIIFDVGLSVYLQAESKVSCIKIENDVIKHIIKTNHTFQYALASSLRFKHKVFDDYLSFVNLISNKSNINKFNFKKLMFQYKRLMPAIHSKCNDDDIDINALEYVLPRLPHNFTSTYVIEFCEDLPKQYNNLQDRLRVKSKRGEKRFIYQIGKGKHLVLLRDDIIDVIDFVIKICMYLVETKKIINKLEKTPDSLTALTEYYFNKHVDNETIEKNLPFNSIEIKLFKKQFGKRYLNHIHEMCVQNLKVELYYHEPNVRYFMTSCEKWANLVKSHIKSINRDNAAIHVISSNRHSVINCLSSWIHDNKELILKQNNGTKRLNENDFLYLASKEYFNKNQEKTKARQQYDAKHGINIIESCFLTGIETNVIDFSRISHRVDSQVIFNKSPSDAIIINIDYAYGRQAQMIIKQLILMFGQQIKSISVVGKCGGLIGDRGDIIIPKKIIDYSNDKMTLIPNNDLQLSEFKEIQSTNDCLGGNLVTIPGTLLQNKMLLNYYKNLWNVSGIEMEGSYYLNEIINGMTQNILLDDLKLRFCYYISDNPLDENKTLSSKLEVEKGIPAVYGITRVLLNKIINDS